MCEINVFIISELMSTHSQNGIESRLRTNDLKQAKVRVYNQSFGVKSESHKGSTMLYTRPISILVIHIFASVVQCSSSPTK